MRLLCDYASMIHNNSNGVDHVMYNNFSLKSALPHINCCVGMSLMQRFSSATSSFVINFVVAIFVILVPLSKRRRLLCVSGFSKGEILGPPPTTHTLK